MRPRKKRKSEPNIGVGDAELPGPNGSLSFTSVLNFSARPSSASTSAPPPTFTAERDSSSVESEDNADDSPSSNLVPTLSSVNGVPHGTVSSPTLPSRTSNNWEMSSVSVLNRLVIDNFRRAPVAHGATGAKHA